LLDVCDDSFLEELDEQNAEVEFKNALESSVAFMLLTRCGINAKEHYNFEDFKFVFDFNTPETVAVLGDATSDISEMALREIGDTIKNLQRGEKNQIHTFAEKEQNEYHNITNKSEGSFDNGADLHNAGGLSTSKPDTADGAQNREIWNASQNIPQNPQERDLRRDDDFGQINESSFRDRQDSNGADRADNVTDGEITGRNGTAQSNRPDEMGGNNEQHQAFSGGNSTERADLQLEYYNRETEDKSLPFFHSDKYINDILKTTPHLKATKQEIINFYATHIGVDERKEYIKSIFNNDYTEITVDDNHRIGYKTYQNVLHLWEGSYNSRTSQSFYDWGVIASYFEGMILLDELTDTMKPLPSVSQQISLIENAEEQKSSAYSFGGEIIDYDLQRGSGVEDGKYRIYEQFSKNLSANQNERFLSKEYGIGGASPIISGTGIGEWHDSKGITLSKGDAKLTLSWSKVAKRIGELIAVDRYLSPKEKEFYPTYLQKQEERRQQAEEERIARGILSTAPTEKTDEDEYWDNQYEDDELANIHGEDTENAQQEIADAELISDKEQSAKYDFHLGNIVYLGASEYEVLSFDGNTVRLFDMSFPLINKELLRADFDRMLRENRLNDHLQTVETEQTPLTEASVLIKKDYAEKEYDSGYEPQEESEQIAPVWEKPKAKIRAQSLDLHPEIAANNRHSFHITNDELGYGGAKEKFNNNLEAIKLLKQLESDQRYAQPSEQEILSEYVGFGGLSQAFDEKNSAWANEYLQLKSLLDDSEYSAARESTLTAFYTSPVVIRAM
jgi:hypothetical protein